MLLGDISVSDTSDTWYELTGFTGDICDVVLIDTETVGICTDFGIYVYKPEKSCDHPSTCILLSDNFKVTTVTFDNESGVCYLLNNKCQIKKHCVSQRE